LGYYLEKFYAEHGRITNDDLWIGSGKPQNVEKIREQK
jgi:hypothetical protein